MRHAGKSCIPPFGLHCNLRCLNAASAAEISWSKSVVMMPASSRGSKYSRHIDGKMMKIASFVINFRDLKSMPFSAGQSTIILPFDIECHSCIASGFLYFLSFGER